MNSLMLSVRGRYAFPVHVENPQLIKIGEKVNIEKRTRIEAIKTINYKGSDYKIIIKDNVHINWNVHIGAINRIEIGNNVLIGSNVLITDHSHGKSNSKELEIAPDKRPLWSKGPVIIKDGVWIGENVSVLPGVIIGKNSIIGANTVITKDVPENCIVAGNPGRIIKQLKVNGFNN